MEGRLSAAQLDRYRRGKLLPLFVIQHGINSVHITG